MKHLIQYLLIVVALIVSIFHMSAQQVGTMYFIETAPVRHYMNPAFQPSSGIYFGIPTLGYSQFNLSTKGLTLYSLNFQKERLFHALKPTSFLNTNLRLDLLSFGFRTNDAYWSFALSQKIDGYVALPKDLFKLLMYGTPETHDNFYQLGKLSVGAQAYTELAAGYSRKLDEQWTVGAKLKVLLGNAHASVKFTDFNLQAGIDQWKLSANGNLNIASPATVIIGNKLSSINTWYTPNGLSDYLAGFGLGVDLGATYKPIEELTLSVGLLDLGAIGWSKNTQQVSITTTQTIEGIDFGSANYKNKKWPQAALDTLGKQLIEAITYNQTDRHYSSSIHPKLNIGAEYAFYEKQFSVGLLSQTVFHPQKTYQEFTAAATWRPTDWFNLGLSHSLLHGGLSSFGAGIGIRAGFFSFFANADYLPFQYGRVNINRKGNASNTSTFTLPYRNEIFNINFGINIVLGNHRDDDKDGVWNKFDKCPDTPRGVTVDQYGCPIDTDGDGVPDYLDQCPDTPTEALGTVDDKGCPKDSDGDGVLDYLDQCPDTPTEANKMVDEKGCLLDTDQDGVPDYLDKCPDTPVSANKMVDKEGCLLDTDGDKVPDYLDRCPDTPAEAHSTIDQYGCPNDTDGDGVPDYLDKCPNTPAEARGMVDKQGCPRDTDGDNIPDYLDNCPKIPGTKANKGCPEVKKEVRSLFQKAMHGIHFETGKDIIRKTSHSILNQIARVLVENPSYLIEIQGHTDNVGSAELNQDLSERRAKAVRNYLINKGIDAKRMTSNGYGYNKPIAPNTTAKGRALNRRVEFVISFEVIHFEDAKFE